MKLLRDNGSCFLSTIEVEFANTPAFAALLADVNGMLDALPVSEDWRAEYLARFAGLLAEARRSAFIQGTDNMADLFGLPIQTEAEPIRPHV